MTVFSTLIGQDHVIEQLSKAVHTAKSGESSQAMTHSWLFVGPPGSGRSNAAMAFAASLGWGVAASAIAVGIYQGAWTVIGAFLGNILASYQIDCMTITGGLMLVAISLRLLKIRQVAVGNLLPALFLAPVIALALHQFN